MKKLFLHEQERFWRQVDLRAPDDCWLWKRKPNEKGYGRFCFRGATFKAHRVAFFLAHGYIDDRLLVLHKCDVRLCCNPRHLYQGDAQANARDAVSKQRNTRLYGEANGRAKLTRKDVESIRRRYKQGNITQKSLARSFGVSEATVSYIVNVGRWQMAIASYK